MYIMLSLTSAITVLLSVYHYTDCYFALKTVPMMMCFSAVLYLFNDGAELPGDGSARVSVTDINTYNAMSGLYCIDSTRVVGSSPNVYLNWYLGEQQIERQSDNFYLGWRSYYKYYYGYQYVALMREPITTVSESNFSCRRESGNRIYSSVSVGVYYPGM